MATGEEPFGTPSDEPAMPLAEAMRTQRAVRRLRDEPVEDALLVRLLDLALHAPSGGNRQPQRFLVVRDPAAKARLAALNRRAWALARRRYERTARDDSAKRIGDAVQWQADRFECIPVLVVVCLAGPLWSWPPFLATSAYGSVYPSVQNLLLAARAVGLGANLLTLPLWSKVLARRALGLPRRIHPVAVVAIGWPLEPYGPTTRRPVGQVIHVDRWGHQPYR